MVFWMLVNKEEEELEFIVSVMTYTNGDYITWNSTIASAYKIPHITLKNNWNYIQY